MLTQGPLTSTSCKVLAMRVVWGTVISSSFHVFSLENLSKTSPKCIKQRSPGHFGCGGSDHPVCLARLTLGFAALVIHPSNPECLILNNQTQAEAGSPDSVLKGRFMCSPFLNK